MRGWPGRVRLLARPSFVSAAVWTWRALRSTRRAIIEAGLDAEVPAAPRRAGRSSGAGVRAVLARTEPTCLERSLVLQRWLSSVGDDREVVVGVRKDEGDVVAAHAWLAGLDHEGEGYLELVRIPALR